MPSASAKPWSERRQRRANTILAAARACFLEKGFADTAVAEIAQRAGISEGLVFSYYATKRDLLHAVLAALYEPLIHDLEKGCQRLQGLRARLRFIIWRHLRVYLESPRVVRLILHEVRSSPEYLSSGLHDMQVRYTQPLIDTINQAIASGELSQDIQANIVRSAVYGTIEHLMWPVLSAHRTIDLDATAEQLTTLTLHGILAKRQETPSIETRLARIEALLQARV